jgi:hypothetical protein
MSRQAAGADMDRPEGNDDDQRPGDFTSFGARLLRQARQKAVKLSPARHSDEPHPFAMAANASMDEVRKVLGELPEDKHVEALLSMMLGIIMNDLYLYADTARG